VIVPIVLIMLAVPEVIVRCVLAVPGVLVPIALLYCVLVPSLLVPCVFVRRVVVPGLLVLCVRRHGPPFDTSNGIPPRGIPASAEDAKLRVFTLLGRCGLLMPGEDGHNRSKKGVCV
jgi:hypothetical protein